MFAQRFAPAQAARFSRVAVPGGLMASPQNDRVGEVASQIDELQTAVEELADDPPKAVESDTVDELKEAVRQAAEASEKLEDQEDVSDG
jgi:outer membrane murein-binding lipoprotein Lpp